MVLSCEANAIVYASESPTVYLEVRLDRLVASNGFLQGHYLCQGFHDRFSAEVADVSGDDRVHADHLLDDLHSVLQVEYPLVYFELGHQ